MASDAGAAVERLRAATGTAAAVPERAWTVHDPDSGAPLYHLVELGPADAVTAVGAVDADSGEVMTYARLPGSGPHLAITAEDARRAAGMPAAASSRLVWRPSRQSASPLYPLWQVSDGAETAYVDLAGAAAPRLDAAGPG